MKLIELNSDCFYRYRLDVSDIFKSDNNVKKVKKWLSDENINCTIVPGIIFFSENKDVVRFIIRWS